MNRNYLIIMLISSALLSIESKRFNYSNKKFFKRRARSKISIPNCYTTACKLELGINTGVKKMNRSEILPYKELNLLHLFTPSGLHLIPLTYLLRLSFHRYLVLAFVLLGYYFLYGSNTFMSLERILSLKSIYLISKNLQLNFTIVNVFALTMIFNLLNGNYDTSSLSFTFSFLFLGSVISGRNLLDVSMNLYTSNIVVAYFLNGSVNFIAPFLGVLISYCFTFIYPFIFINFWVSRKLFGLEFNFISLSFHQIITSLYRFSSYFHHLEVSFGMILLLVLIRLEKKALIFLLFISLDLNQYIFSPINESFYKIVEISK